MHLPARRRSRSARRARASLLLLIALLATACSTATTSGSPARAEPGYAVPPIVGTTLDGKPFDLATYRGKPVIVNFWASWCGPCQAEFPEFTKVLADHAADGLTIVGVVYQDSASAAESFASSHGGTWPNVVDPSGALASAYTVVAPPQTYFIDRSGILQSRQIGGPITDADLARQLAAILP